MSHYFDASALVKRYISEKGSTGVLRLIELQASSTIFIAEITRVEIAAALAARHRMSVGISRAERDKAVSLLLKHCDTDYRIVSSKAEIISEAVNLTQRHRLRGYDAVQLATALVVNGLLLATNNRPLTFVAADNDLIKAAEAEGLAAENANNYQ